MQTSLIAPARGPIPWLATDGAVRSSVRMTRVGMFTAETMARLMLDGTSTSLDQRARELAWLCENLCGITGVRPRVVGEIPSEPCVLVANHTSYLDPLTIASLVRCAPIAKADIASWPCFGEIARRVGVRFVKRDCSHSGARVLREGLRALAQGVSVLVFPEGTTTVGDHVLPFKRGAFGLARLAGVPIVPVAVELSDRRAAWVGDDPFVPHLARTVSRPLTSVTVQFLAPLDPESASADDLAATARAQIERQLTCHGMAATALNVPPYTRAVA